MAKSVDAPEEVTGANAQPNYQSNSAFESSGVQEVKAMPFPISELYKQYQAGAVPLPCPLAHLVKVVCRPFVGDKHVLLQGVTLEKGVEPTVDQVTPESLNYALDFHFENVEEEGVPAGTYRHTHTVWQQDLTTEKGRKALEWDKAQIAQLWATYAGQGTFEKYCNTGTLAAAIGRGINSSKDYFEALEYQFNHAAPESRPVFVNADGTYPTVRIKLTYGGEEAGKYANRLAFPRFGNFIEKYLPNVNVLASRLQPHPSDVYVFTDVRQSKTPGKTPGKTPAPSASGTMTAWPDVN